MDSITSGFNYPETVNPGWMGDLPTIRYTISSTIEPGAYEEIKLRLILQPGDGTPTAFTNIAEIFSARNALNQLLVDADSTGDMHFTNDQGGVPDTATDNKLDGDGADDEDDHDPARIDVFDLALSKITNTSCPYRYGDIIDFQIEISNQGNISANNIAVMEV